MNLQRPALSFIISKTTAVVTGRLANPHRTKLDVHVL